VNAVLRKSLVRLEALVCTGMPGLYRVVVFAFLQHEYSLAALGDTASDMALAQIAGFLTAIGWASLILVRVPMASDRRQAVAAFYTVAWMAAATTAVVTCAVIIVAPLFPGAFNARSFVLVLCGWSAYQLARHFFVARRSYRIAVIFDVLLIGLSFASLTVCRSFGISSSTALALALLAVSAAMFAAIGAPSRTTLSHRYDTKGLQFGMTNLLSGGMTLALVPMASYMCGVSFAGGFSLLLSITAVAMLLPRAISTMQLPELARLTASKSPIQKAVQAMNRTLWISNVAVLGVNVVLVTTAVFWPVHATARIDRGLLIVAGLLLTTQYAVAMGSAVSSSVMMVFERARETASVNMQTTLVFAASCGALALLRSPVSFMAVLLAAIATSAARNALVGRHARIAMDTYVNTVAVKA